MNEDLDLPESFAAGRNRNVDTSNLIECFGVIHGAVCTQTVDPPHQQDKAGECSPADEGSRDEGDGKALAAVKDRGSSPAKSREKGPDATNRKHSGRTPGSHIQVKVRNVERTPKQQDDHLDKKNKAGSHSNRDEGSHALRFQILPPLNHLHNARIRPYWIDSTRQSKSHRVI